LPTIQFGIITFLTKFGTFDIFKGYFKLIVVSKTRD